MNKIPPPCALRAEWGRRGVTARTWPYIRTEGPEMAYVHPRMPNPERIQAVREEQDV